MAIPLIIAQQVLASGRRHREGGYGYAPSPPPESPKKPKTRKEKILDWAGWALVVLMAVGLVGFIVFASYESYKHRNDPDPFVQKCFNEWGGVRYVPTGTYHGHKVGTDLCLDAEGRTVGWRRWNYN